MEDLDKNVRCVHYGRRGVGDLCQRRRILSGGSSSVEVKTSQVLSAKERQVPVSTTTSRKGVLTEIRGKHRPELVDNEQSVITLILRFSKVRPISKFFHSMSSKRYRLKIFAVVVAKRVIQIIPSYRPEGRGGKISYSF